jgi:hypothetical protein
MLVHKKHPNQGNKQVKWQIVHLRSRGPFSEHQDPQLPHMKHRDGEIADNGNRFIMLDCDKLIRNSNSDAMANV